MELEVECGWRIVMVERAVCRPLIISILYLVATISMGLVFHPVKFFALSHTPVVRLALAT